MNAMPFQIIQIDTGNPIPGLLIDSPTDALACIAAMQTETGLRYRMARAVDADTNWRLREATRMVDGTYTPLPDWWTDSIWWRNATTVADHFAHVSECGTMVAYTQTAEKGADNIQTPIKASRYLTKYLSDCLTPQEIVMIGARFAGPADAKLSIAHDAADFARVYLAAEHCAESSSYPSCMRYEAATFGTPCHPVEAYAGHGLAIAYVQLEDGSIPSRAIVWPEKKIFVRVYGLLESDKHNLVTLLTEEGYTRADGFRGAKLSRIPFRGDERVLVPYIDGDTQRLEDRGDYLIVTPYGGIDGSSTAGWSELEDTENTVECENCGRREDEEDAHCVSEQTWCARCADRHAFYCHATGEMFENGVGSRTVITRYGREETWCEGACDGETFHCDATDATYHYRYYTLIEVRFPGGTEIWCAEETKDSYFHCEQSNKYYSTEHYTPIEVSGETWCKEETQDARDALAAENNEVEA
jgi:hypothetical protein